MKPFKLTDKQKKIIMLVGQGLTNEQIARKVYISPTTVKDHISKLCQKLDCTDRSSLAAYSLRKLIFSNNLVTEENG